MLAVFPPRKMNCLPQLLHAAKVGNLLANKTLARAAFVSTGEGNGPRSTGFSFGGVRARLRVRFASVDRMALGGSSRLPLIRAALVEVVYRPRPAPLMSEAVGRELPVLLLVISR